MKSKMYDLPVETPDGIISLEILCAVVNRDDEDMCVALSATIRGESRSYQAETTEEALILLAKDLPEKWHIKSCISCRHGHFCPVGNSDNELFCVTDFAPKEPRDLWQVTENEGERKSRSRTLFDCCDHYKTQAEDYFTYSDYINNIINGNVFSIEYFNNDTRCFGGDITAEELKDLSYDTLEQNTGYYGITKLKDCADSFKLRGWHSDHNFDAVFVTDEDGSITIKKLN